MATEQSPVRQPPCRRHAAVPTGMRCSACGQPYCRDCLVSRFVTSRSAVLVCRGCAAKWSERAPWQTGASGGGGARGAAQLAGRYWWAAPLALLALYRLESLVSA